MSINSGLDLKTTTSEISSLVQCSLECGVTFFFVSDNAQGTFVGFRFMLFTKVLLKELACILIYVHKIFNRRVPFKILLLMCLPSLEKKL